MKKVFIEISGGGGVGEGGGEEALDDRANFVHILFVLYNEWQLFHDFLFETPSSPRLLS